MRWELRTWSALIYWNTVTERLGVNRNSPIEESRDEGQGKTQEPNSKVQIPTSLLGFGSWNLVLRILRRHGAGGPLRGVSVSRLPPAGRAMLHAGGAL